MRRCGVCLVVVHGRVKAGVPSGWSRSGQSRRLDLWMAFSACDAKDSASWTRYAPEDWSSSALAVPTCESNRSPAFDNVGGSGPSISCLSAISNCRNPKASLLYLASSVKRQEAEMWTRISIGGVMVLLHLEKNSLLQGQRGVLFTCYLVSVVQMLTSNHGVWQLFSPRIRR